jgi:outer membrane protein insertion porin family
VGYSIVYDSLNNRVRPSRGERFVFSQDLAGLGGNVKYVRQTINAAKYWPVLKGFIFSASVEAGSILPLGGQSATGADKVRLTDRFFLGEPQIRGFDIRGVGPRVLRKQYDSTSATGFNEDKNSISDDALGGRAYYLGRLELEIPLGSGAKELGLRPSIFLDAGAVFGIRAPNYADGTLQDYAPGDPRLNRDYLLSDNVTLGCYVSDTTSANYNTVIARPTTGCPTGSAAQRQIASPFKEFYFGDSPRPRVSIGIGVNWNSPFGPFRIDLAKVLLKEPGDQTKTLTFNVGTQF